jgi:hypothetical protein
MVRMKIRQMILTGAAVVVLLGSAGLWLARNAAAEQTSPRPQPQAKLPPLELPAYQLPRPHQVVRATYQFAAEHPEVLSYVPCFCGCEQHGHKGSADCFVKSRARNGDVTAWEEHGMVCAMCLAVAETAMEMNKTGASVREIRAEVERKYAPLTSFRTPTPAPPAR